MQKRIITLLMIIVDANLGTSLFPMAWEMVKQGNSSQLNNNFTNELIDVITFFILSLGLAEYTVSTVKETETALNEMSLTCLLFGSIGAVTGLTIGIIISIPMYNLQAFVVNSLLPILVMIALSYLGFRMGAIRTEEWKEVFMPCQKKADTEDAGRQMLGREMENNFHKYKILGINVIIDGRIYDIARTGFLEDVLFIPNFVLHKLQYIVDSGDSLKRARDHCGPDILSVLQKEEGISVEMYDGDFEDISGVDSKLIKLAKLLGDVVAANNYNLNKISEFQSVPVSSINALANVVKPAVIPDETMNMMVIETGTEHQQGVAYLDDDTMIVVEDSQHYMNEQIKAVVTSALQTTTGRMIFTKPAYTGRGINDRKDNYPRNDRS